MSNLVTAPLTGRLDMALSNFAKGYRQNGLVADYLFGRVPVSRQADRYWIFGRESFQLSEQTLRAPGATPQETRFQLSTGSYFCPSRALQSRVSDEERASYTLSDLNMEAVQLNQAKLMLDREQRAFNLVSTTANYAAANTIALSGTSQWDNGASNPIQQVEIGKRQIRLTGQKPNLLVLSDDVFAAVRVHPTLIARYQYTTVTGQLNEQQLAQIFGVEQVVIASAVYHDGTNPGFIWSNIALLCFIAPTVAPAGVLEPGKEGTLGVKDISFGKSFVWADAPSTIGGYGVIIARDPMATAKADIVGVDWYSSEVITASDAGYLFTNVLAVP